MPVLDFTRTVADQQEKEDARFAFWVKAVGEGRARIAKSIFDERTGSKTLPELLTEHFLRSQGAHYVTQLNLGFSRPDFAVFDSPGTPGGALLIMANGDYWHGNAAAIVRDQGQRDMLLQGTAQGYPILRVISVWEKSLYQGNAALELAYFHGEELPRE